MVLYVNQNYSSCAKATIKLILGLKFIKCKATLRAGANLRCLKKVYILIVHIW